MGAHRVSDADRRRHRLRIGAGFARHERRGARRLEAHHARQLVYLSKFLILFITGPVGADVAGVADGYRVPVGSLAKRFADLPGAAPLSPETIGVDRVDDRISLFFSGFARHFERAVKVAVDGNDRSSVHKSLGQLSQRHLSRRQQDEAGHVGGGGVGRGGGGGVTRGGAYESLGAALQRLRYGHDHAPVFKRAGGIAALKFCPKLNAKHLAYIVEMDERRRAFAQRQLRRLFRYRQQFRISFDYSHNKFPPFMHFAQI